MIMLWKAVVEMIKRFDIELVSECDRQNKIDDFYVCDFAETMDPLTVRILKRY